MAKDKNHLFVGDLAILLPAVDPSLSPGGDADLDDSNTYRWDGASLKTRIADVLPVVYGRHIMSPTLINGYIEEGENETVNLLLAWCEGEIESITNLKIKGTPIEELYAVSDVDPYAESAEVSIRLGTENQAIVEHFNELLNTTIIDQLLTSNSPVIFNGIVSNAVALRIEFEISKLYKKLVNSNNLVNWFFSVKVEIRESGGATWEPLGIVELNKKTTAKFKRFFKSEYFTSGTYDLRITKVSEDPDEGSTFGDVTLISVSEVTNEEQNFPYAALTGLRLIAFQELRGSIESLKLTGIVTGRKIRVPKVTYTFGGDDLVPWENYYYDGAALKYKLLSTNAQLFWDGTTYVEDWSANPVWCVRDLLLSERYGLGDDIEASMLDDGSFLYASQYCDEGIDNLDGNKEKRSRLDIVLDKQSDAPELLSIILKSFRGILYSTENTLRMKIEKQEDPVAIFNMGNILSDTFRLQYISKKKANVISIDFINENKGYIRDRLELYDEVAVQDGENPRVQNMKLFGLTRAGQVLREGTIFLNKIKRNRRVINFSAYFDAVLIQPYDVIEFQHDVPGWGSGGRVGTGSTTSNIILDKEVILQPGDAYEIKVRNPLTDEVETRTISNIAGIYTDLDVTIPFTFTPRKNDLWALGVISSDIQQYRVTLVNKTESGKVDITAIEHSNDSYDTSSIVEPQDIYTHLILDIPKVQNLTLTEINNRLTNGGIENKIEVSFRFAPAISKFIKKANEYEIWLSESNGASWNLVGKTDKEFYVIPMPVSAEVIYTVAVVSVSETGDKNSIASSPQQTISIQGFTLPPAKVDNTRYTFSDEIVLSWDKNPESDIGGYEIRTRDEGWLSESVGLVWRGNATSYTIVSPTARSGVIYYIRAFTTSSVTSEQSAEIEPINPTPPAPSLFVTALFQKAFLRWNQSIDVDVTGYEVWRNDQDTWTAIDGNAEEEVVGIVQGTSMVVNVPYATTYFRIVALDRFGRGNFSNSIAVDQIQIEFGDVAPGSITETEIQDDSISTPKLQAGSVSADKVLASSIKAFHIDVGELSAISANLGTVRAGTLIGALIKTSEDPFRLELDNIGLRAYDVGGNLTIQMQEGTLKLIDPLCSDRYSFLDAGGLVLHTPYGDFPYATKICSGVGVSGEIICLEQWVGCPQIAIGIKRLRSYDASRAESCQEWCVFTDNITSYDFGGSNFGWCFDVRAKLVISGGTRTPQTFSVPFDTIKCTGVQTCEIQVSLDFLLYCHGAAPDPYRYGCLCYEVLYRPTSGGTFCSVSFSYLQPHNTITEIRSLNTICHTINLGCSDEWEVKIHETGRHYVTSSFASGGYIETICCIYFDIDCSYYTSISVTETGCVSASAIATTVFQTINCCNSQNVVFGVPIDPSLIICSTIRYNASYSATARIGHSQNTSYASACAEFGGSISKIGEFPPTTPFQKTGSITGVCRAFVGFRNSFNITARGRVSTEFIHAYDCGVGVIAVSASNTYCYKVCCICTFCCQVICCIFIGDAENCDIRTWKSLRDVTSEEVILDPFGEINWLAVAYR